MKNDGKDKFMIACVKIYKVKRHRKVLGQRERRQLPENTVQRNSCLKCLLKCDNATRQYGIQSLKLNVP